MPCQRRLTPLPSGDRVPPWESRAIRSGNPLREVRFPGTGRVTWKHVPRAPILPVTEPASSAPDPSQDTLDVLVFALFAAFVILLFLGYLAPSSSVPYSDLGTLPLVGSLLALFWANWTGSHRGTAVPQAFAD